MRYFPCWYARWPRFTARFSPTHLFRLLSSWHGSLMLFTVHASFSDAAILARLVLFFLFLSPFPLHVNAGERGRAPMDSSCGSTNVTNPPCITYPVTSLSHDLCPLIQLPQLLRPVYQQSSAFRLLSISRMYCSTVLAPMPLQITDT